MGFFDETKEYVFERIKRTVKIKRVSAGEWLDNRELEIPVLALSGLTLDEKKDLLKQITPVEYLQYAKFVSEFNGTLASAEMEKKQ